MARFPKAHSDLWLQIRDETTARFAAELEACGLLRSLFAFDFPQLRGRDPQGRGVSGFAVAHRGRTLAMASLRDGSTEDEFELHNRKADLDEVCRQFAGHIMKRIGNLLIDWADGLLKADGPTGAPGEEHCMIPPPSDSEA